MRIASRLQHLNDDNARLNMWDLRTR